MNFTQTILGAFLSTLSDSSIGDSNELFFLPEVSVVAVVVQVSVEISEATNSVLVSLHELKYLHGV